MTEFQQWLKDLPWGFRSKLAKHIKVTPACINKYQKADCLPDVEKAGGIIEFSQQTKEILTLEKIYGIRRGRSIRKKLMR